MKRNDPNTKHEVAVTRRRRSATGSTPTCSITYFRGVMATKIVSVFNHKGGVSKTTTTFNLGWMLANKGKRVLLVDADPQCNLSGVILGLGTEWPPEDIADVPNDPESIRFSSSQDASAAFWAKNIDKTLYGALRPAFESEPRLLEPVECIEVAGRSGLFLLPGHIRLGEYDVTLGVAQELSGSLLPLRNVPGAPHYLLSITAEALDVDYILVDMSPSLGALNQNLVSISDLLVVPTAPDYFSIMALQSLSQVLPRWLRWAQNASRNEVLASATYPFPEPRLKFAGAIIQRYRLYKSPSLAEPYGTPTGPFKAWIDKVAESLTRQFIPAMESAGINFDSSVYEAADVPANKVLAQIQEFNSLLPKSQEHRVPVFELTQQQLNQVGVVYEGSRRQIDSLARIFSDFADRVNKLASVVD